MTLEMKERSSCHIPEFGKFDGPQPVLSCPKTGQVIKRGILVFKGPLIPVVSIGLKEDIHESPQCLRSKKFILERKQPNGKSQWLGEFLTLGPPTNLEPVFGVPLEVHDHSLC
jgi:hypothetical protein